MLVAQDLSQPLGNEYGGGIALHNPWEALPRGCLPDDLPDSEEQWEVHPVLRVGAALDVGVVHLDRLARVQWHLLVTEDCPVVARKDVGEFLLSLLDDVQLVKLLPTAVVAEGNREAIQGCPHEISELHWHGQALAGPGPRGCEREGHIGVRRRVVCRLSLLDRRPLRDAAVPLPREAPLQAAAPGRVLLVALVATKRTALGAGTVVTNVGAVLHPWLNFNHA
mmetsp:Transcript_57558/g.129755  ORF Transcript_57558/g.129755 Transcript_57558/m.129755 type:complete len:223 (+) Transcript_57558:491-1159(+)